MKQNGALRSFPGRPQPELQGPTLGRFYIANHLSTMKVFKDLISGKFTYVSQVTF